MPSMTIKGLSEPVLAALRARAEANRRSVNREIIAILEAAVQQAAAPGEAAAGADREAWREFARRADAVRERFRERYGTLSDSAELIRDARDER